MNLEIIGYLESARQLISDPRRWTVHYLAEDETGYPVDFDSDKATCWCSLGALRKVVNKDHRDWDVAITKEVLAHKYLRDAINLHPKGGASLAHFNDTHTHQEVMELWDSAIKLAKQDLAKREKFS